jgi:hypothetical protein
MPRHTRWGQTKGPCGQLLNGTGGRRVARARGEGGFFVAGDACRAPATTPSTRAPCWVPSPLLCPVTVTRGVRVIAIHNCPPVFYPRMHCVTTLLTIKVAVQFLSLGAIVKTSII